MKCLTPQGPESGGAEVACQSNKGSVITTGGGFSRRYSLPSWQSAAVSSYFSTVAGTSAAPASGYPAARTTRGYPDISVLANNYIIAMNKALYYGKF